MDYTSVSAAIDYINTYYGYYFFDQVCNYYNVGSARAKNM